MRFNTTRGQAPAVSFTEALFEGLAPDGGLYVPEAIEPWTADEQARLPRRTLTEIGLRALRPFTRGEIDPATLEAVVVEALNFEIPLVEIEPGIFVLELFHGPTFAFKDVGARVMARLMASLHRGSEPLVVLAATSGDTGSAVAHAFHRVPNTRVVVLYPDGRVSPTQEAQLTMFNGERANVRAFAVAGSFDDCHRLTREAFGDVALRRRIRLTSANSVNVGRLLPQSVYYFHAVAQVRQRSRAQSPTGDGDLVFSTPSGNFGNLTAGLLAKRAGLPIGRFVAATNANDVVPEYLDTGTFTPRPSVATLANAMDVGHPSNFERMMWLYGGDVDAMRRDIAGCHFSDDDVRATIRRVYEERGYLLDPHSAIAYKGLKGQVGRVGQVGIFLATAHPAKFAEIVEPIVGREIDKPAPLAQALARPRHIIRIEPSLAAVMAAIDG
jgi:threonine synthase